MFVLIREDRSLEQLFTCYVDQTYIQASCRRWGTSWADTLGTCAACTCRSRSLCRTCTGRQHSWWCCVGRSPCSPRRSARCSGSRTLGRHTLDTALPAAEASGPSSSSHLRCLRCSRSASWGVKGPHALQHQANSWVRRINNCKYKSLMVTTLTCEQFVLLM